MKRILVTGSDGQLGMTLQELAPHYPDMEFIFTNKSTLDITKPEEVSRVFEQLKPEYCINCAAYTQVDQAEREPDVAYELNVNAVANLVRECKQSDTVLIHLSTDYVFDGTREEGYRP
ncbi:MAG: sugar nucleotide-binding protein, partial [Eudoraea sp.]|nr:sugar nucleotide-binding protein [Eudoraea sp.]